VADERVGYEALRPVIDSQMALWNGVFRFNTAVMRAWLGAGAPAAEGERPSEAAKKAEYMSP